MRVTPKFLGWTVETMASSFTEMWRRLQEEKSGGDSIRSSVLGMSLLVEVPGLFFRSIESLRQKISISK